MQNRQNQVIELVRAEAADALKRVLADAIAEHYAEADWDRITGQVVTDLAGRLSTSLALEKIVTDGDLRDAQGNLNVDGLLEALRELVAARKGTKNHGVLSYFVKHAEHALKLL